jgi:hypothetical protein
LKNPFDREMICVDKNQIQYEIDRLQKEKNDLIEKEINDEVLEMAKAYYVQRNALDESTFIKAIQLLCVNVKHKAREIK